MKIGDKVKCIRSAKTGNLNVGDVSIIIAIHDDFNTVQLDGYGINWYSMSRFELVDKESYVSTIPDEEIIRLLYNLEKELVRRYPKSMEGWGRKTDWESYAKTFFNLNIDLED